MTRAALYVGDALETMRDMEAASVDAIVTDPPYGLSFMGKDWDHGIPGVAFWEAALRSTKPGAHLLAFGGTRTHHRLMCAIEDAGWEIRDCLMWVYGSGFPKSHSVSAALDRRIMGKGPRGHAIATAGTVQVSTGKPLPPGEMLPSYTPESLEAKQWDGWGTALKPAWEPIILARKPLTGTVAANVLEHGTGGLNIDGCRIEGVAGVGVWGSSNMSCQDGRTFNASPEGEEYRSKRHQRGRWPANVVHDGSEEVVGLFPRTVSGVMKAGQQRQRSRGRGGYHDGFPNEATVNDTYGDVGSAARFFYCAKASRAEREAGLSGEEKPLHWSSGAENPGAFQSDGTKKTARNNHPTVKPIALMRWLCRLVTPPDGLILDPFCGSGSTGVAASLEGFLFVGIDDDAEFCEIARKRIAAATEQTDLFTGPGRTAPQPETFDQEAV